MKFQKACVFDMSAMKGMNAPSKCRCVRRKSTVSEAHSVLHHTAVEIRPGSSDQIVGLLKATFLIRGMKF